MHEKKIDKHEANLFSITAANMWIMFFKAAIGRAENTHVHWLASSLVSGVKTKVVQPPSTEAVITSLFLVHTQTAFFVASSAVRIFPLITTLVLSYLDPPLYEPEPIIAIIPATPKIQRKKITSLTISSVNCFEPFSTQSRSTNDRKINPDRKLRKSLQLSKNQLLSERYPLPCPQKNA